MPKPILPGEPDHFIVLEHTKTTRPTQDVIEKLANNPPNVMIVNGHGSRLRKYPHNIRLFGEKQETGRLVKSLYEQMGNPKDIFLYSCYGGAFRGNIQLFPVGTTLLDVGSSTHPIWSNDPIIRYLEASKESGNNVDMVTFFAKESLASPETISISRKVTGTDGKEHNITIKAIATKRPEDIQKLLQLGTAKDFFQSWSEHDPTKAGKAPIDAHFVLVADEETKRHCAEEIQKMQDAINASVRTAFEEIDLQKYKDDLFVLSVNRMKQDRVTELLKPQYGIKAAKSLRKYNIWTALERNPSAGNFLKKLFNDMKDDSDLASKFSIISLAKGPTAQKLANEVTADLLKDFEKNLPNLSVKQVEEVLSLSLKYNIREFSLMILQQRKDINVDIVVDTGPLSHETLLHDAIRRSDYEIINELLKYGNPNIDINRGRTEYQPELVTQAEEINHHGSIPNLTKSNSIVLIRGDGEPNERSKSQLYLADGVEGVDNLLSDVFSKKNTPTRGAELAHEAPLLLAIKENKNKAVEALLKHHETNVNQVDSSGKTPLTAAIEKDNIEAIEALLKHPAINVNQVDSSGKTPLTAAIEQSNLKAVEALLKHPAINVNTEDSSGKTPLTAAIKSVEEITEANKKTFANIMGMDVQNLPKCLEGIAAQKATNDIENNRQIIVALLANKKIDVNKPGLNGYTPLQLAALDNNIKAVAALLTNDEINVNKELEDNGATPLLLAYDANGYNNIVQALLVHANINVNKPDLEGNTLLSLAIERDDESLIETLLKKPEIIIDDKLHPSLEQKGFGVLLKKALSQQEVDSMRQSTQQKVSGVFIKKTLSQQEVDSMGQSNPQQFKKT